MVVYEIRDPAAVVTHAPTKPLRPELEPTIAVYHGQEIGGLVGGRRQQAGQGRKGERRRRMIALDDTAIREVLRLLDEINTQLAAQGAMIHLVMVASEDGVAIDLYDCSDGIACRGIHDINVDIEDLPVLLARLTKKTGIMVDMVS